MADFILSSSPSVFRAAATHWSVHLKSDVKIIPNSSTLLTAPILTSPSLWDAVKLSVLPRNKWPLLASRGESYFSLQYKATHMSLLNSTLSVWPTTSTPSAKKRLDDVGADGRSVIRRRNKSGPYLDHCGTSLMKLGLDIRREERGAASQCLTEPKIPRHERNNCGRGPNKSWGMKSPGGRGRPTRATIYRWTPKLQHREG